MRGRWLALGTAALVGGAAGLWYAMRDAPLPPPMPLPAPAAGGALAAVTADELQRYAMAAGTDRPRRKLDLRVVVDPPPQRIELANLYLVGFAEVDPVAGVPPANAFPCDFQHVAPNHNGKEWVGSLELQKDTWYLAVLARSEYPSPGDRKSAIVHVLAEGDPAYVFTIGTGVVPDFNRPPSDLEAAGKPGAPGPGGSLLVRPESYTLQPMTLSVALAAGIDAPKGGSVFVVGYSRKDPATGRPENGTHPEFVWRSGALTGTWPMTLEAPRPPTPHALVLLDSNGNGEPDDGEPSSPPLDVPATGPWAVRLDQRLETRPKAPEGAPSVSGLPEGSVNQPGGR